MAISLTELLLENGAIYAAQEAMEESGYKMRDPNIGSKSLNPDAPMEVDLITDRIIERAKLKPVTDPISYSGDIPTDGGLFSPLIFGRTPNEKSRQFAYIELNERFFHPYIYEILDDLMPARFKKCASGNGSWKLDKDGLLVELKEGESGYSDMNNGISWLVDVFPKMKFTESNSLVRKDKLKLLKDFKPEDCIITKWLVIPIKYRDIDKNSSTHKLPEINEHYNNLIRYANSLRDSTFAYFNYVVKFNLQNELVAIRKYGQSLLEKKTGFFHKAILGKSVDRGSRDVISVPSFRGYQKPDDNPVDMFHSGIPLTKCLIIGYDFIMRYCLQFFANMFRDRHEIPSYKLNPETNTYEISRMIEIEDQLQKFNTRYIDKKINRFKNSHGTRFELITITGKDGHEYPIHMKGQFRDMSAAKVYPSRIIDRPMTWTDLFYQAAVNTLSDKYVYITRYPIEGYNSIFPTQCLPLSTINTVAANIEFLDGEAIEYERYPVIDLNTPTEKISNQFIDTVTISDLFLDIIGGD